MLLFSFVMVVVAARLEALGNRKVIYASLGVAGTVSLNVVRVFSIAYYGYAYASDCNQVDFFHNWIGVVLLPLWLVMFVALVVRVEGWLASRTTKQDRDGDCLGLPRKTGSEGPNVPMIPQYSVLSPS